MDRVVRSIARLSPRLMLLALICSSLSSAAPMKAVPPTGEKASAMVYFPEVRLRKLHLVRPDLIPFPIEYDVYC